MRNEIGIAAAAKEEKRKSSLDATLGGRRGLRPSASALLHAGLVDWTGLYWTGRCLLALPCRLNAGTLKAAAAEATANKRRSLARFSFALGEKQARGRLNRPGLAHSTLSRLTD